MLFDQMVLMDRSIDLLHLLNIDLCHVIVVHNMLSNYHLNRRKILFLLKKICGYEFRYLPGNVINS